MTFNLAIVVDDIPAQTSKQTLKLSESIFDVFTSVMGSQFHISYAHLQTELINEYLLSEMEKAPSLMMARR